MCHHGTKLPWSHVCHMQWLSLAPGLVWSWLTALSGTPSLRTPLSGSGEQGWADQERGKDGCCTACMSLRHIPIRPQPQLRSYSPANMQQDMVPASAR